MFSTRIQTLTLKEPESDASVPSFRVIIYTCAFTIYKCRRLYYDTFAVKSYIWYLN